MSFLLALPAALLSAFLSAAVPSSPQTTSKDELLNQLLADYKSYGLPFPPEEAELAILPSPSVSISNGVRRQDMHLVFLLKRATTGSEAAYWYGCSPGPRWHSIELKPTNPTLASFNDTAPIPPDFRGDGFPVYHDLALAVQCYSKGWKDLGAALLERSRKPPEDNSFIRPKRRPKDDRAALAEFAWYHFCNRFARADSKERADIVSKMKRLTTSPYRLNTPGHQGVLADMERTIVPVTSEPGSLERAVDDLLGFSDTWGSFAGAGWDERNQAARYAPYVTLQNAGMQAVPVLIKHLDDFRMTRRVVTNRYRSYSWHLRVSDLVAQLLSGLSEDPFAYDFLEREGRGMRLDRAHVEHWAKGLAGTNELDLLVKQVKASAGKRGGRESLHALVALGARYPDEFRKLFEQGQKENTLDHAWFEALPKSKLSEQDKQRLLLASARASDNWQQIFALREMARLHHPDTGKFIIAALQRQPKTPKEPYWQSGLTNFVQIGIWLDDDTVWESMLKTARRVDMGLRMEMIHTFARGEPEKLRNRSVRFLREFLKDTEGRKGRQHEGLFQGPGAGFMYDEVRVCDIAAEQLAHILGMKDRPESTWKQADWDRFLIKVEAELEKKYPTKPPKGDK
jgi:hypothetical protein